MTHRLLFVPAVAAGLLVAAHGGRLQAAQGSYQPIAEIHVGGAASFDYLNVDSAAHRLYLTHGTEVVVIDTVSNAVVGRITDTPGVHGIALAPNGRGFTSNGRENKVSIVDLKTLQTLSKVDTGANPDAILYEPKQKEVYALNHTGHSATVINADTGAVVATIPLSGTAETGQADPALGRVFVNIEDKDAIDVIDIATHTVVATWPVAPAESPTGMAIDTATHRLFVGGGPSQVMIDATTGKVVSSVPICGGTDATWFDPGLKLSFSSCSDGHIAVAHMDSPSTLTLVETIDTTPRARTMALDASTHRLYVAGQKWQPVDPNAPPPPPPARGRGRGGPPAVPDSFFVMVIGRK
jgi:DNA-binding beta-propeller fold protein YncE